MTILVKKSQKVRKMLLEEK